MRIYDSYHRLVVANRQDLREWFPEAVLERLPEDDHIYAWGTFWSIGFGCPMAQAGFRTGGMSFAVRASDWYKAYDIACSCLQKREPIPHVPVVPVVPKPDLVEVGS